MTEETTKKVRIAFTVIQDERGFYQVLTNVNEKIEVERQAGLLDIKVACGEIREALLRNETINAVMGILAQKEVENGDVATYSEEVSAPEAE